MQIVGNVPAHVPVTLVMVCIYIFLFIERPWESISYLEGIPIERAFAIAMIVVAFIHDKFRIVSSPTNKWVYGLLLLHFILAPFAFNPGDAVEQGIEYAKIVVLYMLMLSVADDETSLKLLVKVFAFSMMFYALHSLWEYHNGRHDYKMGITRMLGVDSTFNDPNSFGASLVLSLPFVYVLMRFESSKWVRSMYYCYIPLVLFCVVQTGSRSAFVSLIFLALLWVAIQQGKRMLMYLALVAMTLALVWNVMPEEKQIRIRTLWDENAGPANAHESAEGRKEGFVVSWKMFRQSPWTGVGAGGKNFIGYRLFNGIDEAGRESATQAHNLYGEVLAEFGVGGALCLIGLIASVLGCCVRARNRLTERGITDSFLASLAGAIAVCLMLLLLLGLGGHNFYRPLWLWLAAWAGVLLALATNRAISQSETTSL